jgi:hypothetical protein
MAIILKEEITTRHAADSELAPNEFSSTLMERSWRKQNFVAGAGPVPSATDALHEKKGGAESN